MTAPIKYRDTYFPVKYFLNSYRALSDGKNGVQHLEKYLQSETFLLSDWKVIWIGACALLRTSMALFKVDAKSCINQKIRAEICAEWKLIQQKEDHPIFWNFLQKERNNILHHYEWAAYEMWMDQDGTTRPARRMSLLGMKPKDVSHVLIMRGGPYKDRNSLDLLKESAEWVEARIYGAIHRAGFDPDEDRNPVNFQKRPPVEKTLLKR